MNRVPFETVSQFIDRMHHDQTFTTDEAIAKQCKLVADFIQGAGWQEDEFWAEWISRSEEGLDNPTLTPYPVKTQLN